MNQPLSAKLTSFRLPLLFLAVAFPCFGTASAQQKPQPVPHRVNVVNRASSPVVYLVASSSTAGSAWTANLLASTEIAPNASTSVVLNGSPTACIYNLKATLASGKSLLSSNVNLCATSTWVVVDIEPMLMHMHAAPLPANSADLQPIQPIPGPPPPPMPPALQLPTEAAAPTQPAPHPGAPVAPVPLPQNHQHVVHPAAPAPGDPTADAEYQAYTHAPQGHTLYTIPPTMDLGHSYTASAVIYSPTATGVPGAAHSLKVSPSMIVTLTEPTNPGAFKIEPGQSACQFIPEGGVTEWDFKVTPVDLGATGALHFRTTDTFLFTSYIVYGSPEKACDSTNPLRRAFPSDTETVTVSAFGGLSGRALNFIADNPGKCLTTLLGGGLGIPGLVTAIKWLLERYRQRKHPNPTDPSPQPTRAQV